MPLTISCKEAGQRLGVSQQVFDALVKEGRVPALRFDERRIRVSVRASQEFANAGEPIVANRTTVA
jgi:predicted site-specific integrase-resolvase